MGKTAKRIVVTCIIGLILFCVGALFGAWARDKFDRDGIFDGIDDSISIIELQHERAVVTLLHDLDSAQGAIERGQISIDELRRERDAARAELNKYYRDAELRINERDASLGLIEAIGRELERRGAGGD